MSSIDVHGGRLSADVEAPLEKVLAAIARASGVEILVHGAAVEQVRIACRDVPLEVALRRVLGATSFAFVYATPRSDRTSRLTLAAVHVYVAGPATTAAAATTVTAIAATGIEDDDPARVLLESKSWVARKKAVRALATASGDDAVDALGRAVSVDGDPWVREKAARGLGKISSEKAVAPLSDALLRDEDPFVREAAATSLGKSLSEAAVGPLAHALRGDPGVEVREAAAAALGRARSDAAVALLAEAAERDESDIVRKRAEAALRSIRGATQNRLPTIATTELALVPWARARMLRCCTSPDRHGMPTPLVRVALLVATVVALESDPAVAIPVFARIYGKPCGTCHSVFPQLNPAGEEFRAHGFHGLPAAAKPIRVGGLELPGLLPLAVYSSVGEDFTKERSRSESGPTRACSNLQFLSALAGGELGPHLAFLMDYEILETEPDTCALEVNTLPEQAYLQAHAETPNWLGNLRLGWYELPLGISPRIHRLSATPYLTYALSGCRLLGTAPPGVDCADVPVLGQSQIGGEASLLHPSSGFGASFGITKGSNNRLDNQGSPDFYFRLGEQVGFQKLGIFLQYSPDSYDTGPRNQTLQVGPDLSLYTRRFRLLAQFLASFESDPTGHSEDLWIYGGFIEGEYRVTATIIGLLRAESAFNPEFDDTGEGGVTHVRDQLWTLVGGGQWLLRENLKLVAEVSYAQNHQAVQNSTTSAWFVTIRVVTAFWMLDPFFGLKA